MIIPEQTAVYNILVVSSLQCDLHNNSHNNIHNNSLTCVLSVLS